MSRERQPVQTSRIAIVAENSNDSQEKTVVPNLKGLGMCAYAFAGI